MRMVQTIQTTRRAVNNVVIDVVPAMSMLLRCQARGDGQPEPTVAIDAAEIEGVIAALVEAQRLLTGEPAPAE